MRSIIEASVNNSSRVPMAGDSKANAAKADRSMSKARVIIREIFYMRVDMAGFVNTFFSSAGLDYRMVGGLATYLYVEEAEPDDGRLTKDIDIAVRREDLARIAKAATPGIEADLIPALASRLAQTRART